MFPTPIARTAPWFQRTYKIGLPILLLIWLIPLLAIMLTSIRSPGDINKANYWGVPSELRLFNYVEVFTLSPVGGYLLNSLLISTFTVIGALTLSCLTGFAFAIYKFRGNLLLFFLFIAGNFVPFQILMVPVRDLTVSTGLYDTMLGLVLFHIAFQTGFCTLFMRNFMRALPFELVEAARMDGASPWLIFTRVILPCVRPALAALAVLIFTFIWNDYFWAVVLVQSDGATPVTAGLKSLNGQWIGAWHLISAGSIMAALPPVLAFFLMQKHFIAGLTLGASKG